MTLAEMERRYRAGANLAGIARAAGCVPCTVSRSLRLLGVPIRKPGGNNRWPRAVRAKRQSRIVAFYYGERLSIVATAASLGVSSWTVWRELHAVGFPLRPPGRRGE